MEINSKKEILFYYESRQNPNGDPGFENQPRLMSDGTIMVTDVRIKRTIRDYAKNVLKKIIFVDYDKDGKPVTADNKAREIIGSLTGDVMEELLKKTFDIPLFGSLIPIRADKNNKNKKNKDGEEGEEEEGRSEKLTGPVQFGIGRSVNQVNIINPTISGRFVGKVKQDSKDQFSTFGKFYSVEYALIKIQGAINPVNLEKYQQNKEIQKRFIENEKNLSVCLWNGTNELVTRSKFPQRSIFYLDIEYENTIYNDISLLVDENKKMKDKPNSLVDSPLIFDKFLNAMKERRKNIKKIHVKCCDELKNDTKNLINKIKSMNIPVEEI